MDTNKSNDKLAIIWSSSERDVALKLAFMYALNSKKLGWWKEVKFIIWGPSAQLLANDNELQLRIKELKEFNVELLACKFCSDSYQVPDILENLGVTVIYMGEPLTQLLKTNWKILNF